MSVLGKPRSDYILESLCSRSRSQGVFISMKMHRKHALDQTISHICFKYTHNVCFGKANVFLYDFVSGSLPFNALKFFNDICCSCCIPPEGDCHDYCWNLSSRLRSGAGDPGQWWRHMFFLKNPLILFQINEFQYSTRNVQYLYII